MSFGLCNTPSNSYVSNVYGADLSGNAMETLLIYLDDIILYSSNLVDHFDKMNEVLSKLKNAGLRLKPSKCEFLKDEAVYLGYVACKDGIKPNTKVIKSVKKLENS